MTMKRALPLILIVFALAACSSKPDIKSASRPAFEPTGNPAVDNPKIETLEEDAKKFPDDKDVHIRLGNAYIKLKRFEEGAQELEEAYRISEDQKLNLYLANLYVKRRMYEKALERYYAYKNYYPSDPFGNVLIGNMYLMLRQPEKAVSNYDTAIRKSSGPEQYFASYSGKGNAYHSMNKKAEAISAYRKALEYKPHDGNLKSKIKKLEGGL